MNIGDRLVKLQFDAEANYARADIDINESNVQFFASKSELSNSLLSILAKNRMIQPEDVVRRKRQQAVAEFKAERVQTYRSSVTEQLRGLTKIRWIMPQ